VAVDARSTCLGSQIYGIDVWNGKYVKRDVWSPNFTIFSSLGACMLYRT